MNITAGTILEHWRALILIWIAFVFISTMPSPEKAGWTASWAYRWLFMATHTISGAVPRIIATLFPQFTRFIPWMAPNGKQDPSAPPPTP